MKLKLFNIHDIEYLSEKDLLDLWEDSASRRNAIDFANCDMFFSEYQNRHDDWRENERVQKILKAWMGI